MMRSERKSRAMIERMMKRIRSMSTCRRLIAAEDLHAQVNHGWMPGYSADERRLPRPLPCAIQLGRWDVIETSSHVSHKNAVVVRSTIGYYILHASFTSYRPLNQQLFALWPALFVTTVCSPTPLHRLLAAVTVVIHAARIRHRRRPAAATL